jgi:hypothetical protein
VSEYQLLKAYPVQSSEFNSQHLYLGLCVRKRSTDKRKKVLSSVVMESSASWCITPCSPLKDNRRFGGNISPPVFVYNPKCLFATYFHDGFLLGLFIDPEDGGDMSLRNVGCLSTDYAALYPRRYYSSGE